MKLKLPNLKAPNLKLPNSSTPKSKIMDLIKKNKGNTDSNSILNMAKSKVPEPLKKFIPNIGGDSGSSFDISSIMGKSSMDVEGILSKNSDMSNILGSFKTDYNFDVGASFSGSDIFSQTFDFS